MHADMSSRNQPPLLAPCMVHCLQGTDIRAVLQIVAQVQRNERPRDEAFEEAWRLVTQTNPLPATCGRVCPHPCEVHCNRRDKDAPVSINAVERFLGDWALSHRLAFVITTLIFFMSFFTRRDTFIRAASTTTAVPCWSS
ncbi:MAG: hypothetical protein C4524_14730, partial [Candidatus Zixiibacteriota bacterium]